MIEETSINKENSPLKKSPTPTFTSPSLTSFPQTTCISSEKQQITVLNLKEYGKQKSIENRRKRLEQNQNSKVSQFATHIYSTADLRGNAELEYFKMVCFSYKVSCPQMDKICLFNNEEFYQKAKEENVPFYKYHDWVKNEFDKKWLDMLISKANSQKVQDIESSNSTDSNEQSEER